MKLKCIIYAPVDCYAGYGARSRDIIKSIIKLKEEEWDIKIFPCNWGNTSHGFLEAHNESDLSSRLIGEINYRPDVFMMITVPNEFQNIGKYNIGITAGIETTLCDHSWIEGINKMDLTLVSSQHAKTVLETTTYEKRNNQGTVGHLKVEKPIEVLFEGFSDVFTQPFKEFPLDIKEDFAFLFVGSWLQGSLGEDRKNVGLLLKVFLETFKNKKHKPALVLKTQGATSSYYDREQILKKIKQITNTVDSKDLPKVYLLHGEMSDKQMNDLYNNPKIKAMVSLTKGEGYGRPLLEFSLMKKPIIASGWSGQLDFLNKEFTTLIPGVLTKIDPSAVVPNILLVESQWFSPNITIVSQKLIDMYENYKTYGEKAKRQAFYSKTNFSWEKMTEKLSNIFILHLPDFPKPIQLKLPSLDKIKLPKKELQ
jgi:glycosyltransferase involved in cell wall biosynthesis